MVSDDVNNILDTFLGETKQVDDKDLKPSKFEKYSSDVDYKPVARRMDGFEHHLNRMIDSGDFVFDRVIDLGYMCGVCDHCGTTIRYEFWLKSVSTGREMKLGSVCITKADQICGRLKHDRDGFLRILTRRLKPYQEKFKVEDNKARFKLEIEFLTRYLHVKHDDYTAFSIYRKILSGDNLKSAEIKTVRYMMDTIDVAVLEKAAEQQDVERRREFDRKAAEEQREFDELSNLYRTIVELSKYMTSPFVADMANRVKKLQASGAPSLMKYRTTFSEKQLEIMRRIASENDLAELSSSRDADALVMEEQKAAVERILARFESGEIKDFELKKDGRNDGRTYRQMFEQFFVNVQKRRLTDGEWGVVERFFTRNGDKRVVADSRVVDDKPSDFKDEDDKECDFGAGRKLLTDKNDVKDVLNF